MQQIKQINKIEYRKKERFEDKILKCVQLGLIGIFCTAVVLMIIKQVLRTFF